ncbi:MAG TPA: DUF881 domain-containing protein [Actinotalea sp.]|nr:DUF881 domain-containing protein [Actinotalea sp.]
MGGEHRDPSHPPPEATAGGSAWRDLGRALAPRATKAQLLAGLLTGLLGFAIVVQLQQGSSEDLSGLRQDELVRILDETNQRTDALEQQAADLRAQRAELVDGSDTERAAREAAAERAAQQGILAGRLPAQGPGVELIIREPAERIPALVLLNVLEELRNAGAEAIQLADQRITASSYIADTEDGVQVDGVELTAPYRWLAIGDPDTITPALEMPGGALAAVRNATGSSSLIGRDLVEVTALRVIDAPRFATPVPAAQDG